jgi:hypothetical protein
VATGVVTLAVAIAGNTAELDRPLVRRLRTLQSGGLPGAHRPAYPAKAVMSAGGAVAIQAGGTG